MKYVFDPSDYNFNPSNLYAELGDFFGTITLVKSIASSKEYGHHWYFSINKLNWDDRYEIRHGVLTKNKVIEKADWPTVVYLGTISNKIFAEELLKHLMGTARNVDVETDGKERLKMKCLYLNPSEAR